MYTKSAVWVYLNLSLQMRQKSPTLLKMLVSLDESALVCLLMLIL